MQTLVQEEQDYWESKTPMKPASNVKNSSNPVAKIRGVKGDFKVSVEAKGNKEPQVQVLAELNNTSPNQDTKNQQSSVTNLYFYCESLNIPEGSIPLAPEEVPADGSILVVPPGVAPPDQRGIKIDTPADFAPQLFATEYGGFQTDPQPYFYFESERVLEGSIPLKESEVPPPYSTVFVPPGVTPPSGAVYIDVAVAPMATDLQLEKSENEVKPINTYYYFESDRLPTGCIPLDDNVLPPQDSVLVIPPGAVPPANGIRCEPPSNITLDSDLNANGTEHPLPEGEILHAPGTIWMIPSSMSPPPAAIPYHEFTKLPISKAKLTSPIAVLSKIKKGN